MCFHKMNMRGGYKMARPSKCIQTNSKHFTREEKKKREEQESKLRGKADKIKPSSYLSRNQKKIFNQIVKELEASEILGNLDVYVLETTSIAIDRLREIETIINKNIENIYDKTLMASKEKYTKDLWRGCNELSLSPQARAKLGNINIQTQNAQNDVLLKALRGEE